MPPVRPAWAGSTLVRAGHLPGMTSKPSPAALSRTLSRAGVPRSESEATSIRGYRRYTPGFNVTGPRQAWEERLTFDRDDAAAFVTFTTIDSYGANVPHTEMLDRLRAPTEQALRDAGFEFEVIEHRGAFRGYRVTRP